MQPNPRSDVNVLVPFDGNPCPEPYRQGFTRTDDGFDLRFAVFRSDIAPCKGTIVLLHGRNECIEKYAETIAGLVGRGFDVGTFDWRGQGRSTRFFRDARRGYVDDFSQYATDLDQVFSTAILPETRPPFFTLAHSMGALIALLTAPMMANRIERMVMSAPFLGLSEEGPPPGFLSVAAGAMCYCGLGRTYIGAGPRGITALRLETNKLTSDAARFARNKAILDPDRGLGLGAITAGWLRAAARAIAAVHDPAHMASIRIPVLLVAAGAERVVSSTAAEAYARRIRAGSLITIAGARHELMQEADRYRDQFFAAFDAFVPGGGA
ncbi:MAG: alpha/beta hydrolase [Oricola sp.]|nr:MAG: alpha/beta hydrolase [Oricola sp.]